MAKPIYRYKQRQYCAHCLQPFDVDFHDGRPGRRRLYCSNKCRQAAYRARRKSQDHATR